jgi:hypothetical protein
MIAKSDIFQNENKNKYFLIFSYGSIYSEYIMKCSDINSKF